MLFQFLLLSKCKLLQLSLHFRMKKYPIDAVKGTPIFIESFKNYIFLCNSSVAMLILGKIMK